MGKEIGGVQGIASVDQPFMCSFCLRPREKTGVLVGAPAVGICRPCAEAALVLFQQAAPEIQPIPRAPWDMFSDAELLCQLPRVAKARDDVESHLRNWVTAARERKLSWANIGESLGMSRQSAWERFHQANAAPSTKRAPQSAASGIHGTARQELEHSASQRTGEVESEKSKR